MISRWILQYVCSGVVYEREFFSEGEARGFVRAIRNVSQMKVISVDFVATTSLDVDLFVSTCYDKEV